MSARRGPQRPANPASAGPRPSDGRGRRPLPGSEAATPGPATTPAPRPLRTLADALAAAHDPFLIGVRHHSPACAAAIPHLLAGFRPERLYIELPADFQGWLPWLAHPDAVAPLALAAAGEGMSFYPFADYSPELAAIRWAFANGVEVEAFDLPVGAGSARGPSGQPHEHAAPEAAHIPDWDTLVEAPAVTSTPESTRRAALLYGWALRRATGLCPRDQAREAHMRARLNAAPGLRRAVVTGAFHNAALVADSSLDPCLRDDTVPPTSSSPTTSLIPYRVDLFDTRSGYPAGVTDPAWHARVYGCLTTGTPIDAMVASVMVEICRAIRDQRHVAGPPDALEALRIALELARIRGLAAPGRAEVLEGVQAALGQGELLGRGRVIAKALERVLVGTGRGRLAPGTPRSGLLPSVEALIAGLRLPGPDETEEKLLRLDPLRSDLDRRRHVALQRLVALEVPYAKLADNAEETLTHAWRVRWEPATEAALALASAFGADLEQAATGSMLRARPVEDEEDGVPAAVELEWVTTVAECGLVTLAQEGLRGLGQGYTVRAGLAEMVDAVGLVDRIGHGHVPGLQAEGSPEGVPGGVPAFTMEALEIREALYVAAVRSLDGLVGSTDRADARALGALVRLAVQTDRADDGRLGVGVDTLAVDGAPRIAGAAAIARLRLGRASADEVGVSLGNRIDGAVSADGRQDLGDRLSGAIDAAGTLLESHPALLDGIAGPVEGLADEGFLLRLPALRHGFDVLSTGARTRLLATIAERLGEDAPGIAPLDAEMAVLDHVGRSAVIALGLWPGGPPPPLRGTSPLEGGGRVDGAPPPPLRGTSPPRGGLVDLRGTSPLEGVDVGLVDGRALDALTRWRLILGRDGDELEAQAGRYANALDELYGHGHGEGSRGEAGGGGRGGQAPTTREWGEEIGALFGEGVRVEVLGRAAERGDANALLLIDPEAVTPSVALLEQALSLKGGLSEDQLAMLRRLCRRVVTSLVEALAVRVRPALTGLSTPRPTHRPTDRLHLRRTIEANLHTVRNTRDTYQIVPERLYFRARARRQMDWHIVLVVDTSGSMESSVVHAAMMAAILSALPAVSVSFYGFADDVIDFTERVEDPLALLLEVRIGGGTRIHRALRYARERVRVPTRTLLVLVTDFEEGGSPTALIGEVRALAEAGVTLLGLAALDEAARPRFSESMAARVVSAGMPVAALTPLELARWVAEKIRGV